MLTFKFKIKLYEELLLFIFIYKKQLNGYLFTKPFGSARVCDPRFPGNLLMW